MPDFYEVGREKVREYATAVQNAHPAHYDEQAARELGHSALVAPLTFVSVIGIIAQKYLFEQIVPGFDLSQILQTDQKLVFPSADPGRGPPHRRRLAGVVSGRRR